MRYRRTIALASSALLFGVGSGCVDSSPLDATGVDADQERSTNESQLPGEYFVGVVPAAATLRGDLYIAEQYSGDGTRVAKVSPGGDVKELPEAPALRSRALVSSQDSLVLLGVSCDSDACESASLAAFAYSEPEGTWSEVDVPQSQVFPETMVEAVGGSTDRALVDVGAGLVAVAGQRIVDVTAPVDVGVQSLTCGTNSGVAYDVRTAVEGRLPPAEGNDDPLVMRGGLQYGVLKAFALEPGGGSGEWRETKALPMENPPTTVSVICDDNSLLVIADNIEFALVDGDWKASPKNEVLSSSAGQNLIQVQTATTGTGVTVSVGVGSSEVVSRTSDGQWTLLEESGSSVLGATHSAVFVADQQANSVRLVEVNSK